MSCNLIDPGTVGPAALYDTVAGLARHGGGSVTGAELVGLIPEEILAGVPEHRWPELGLSEDQTVESRLAGGRADVGGGKS